MESFQPEDTMVKKKKNSVMYIASKMTMTVNMQKRECKWTCWLQKIEALTAP